MKKITYLFYICMSLVLLGCEKTISFDDADIEDKLVVNGLLTSSAPVAISVYNSYNVIDGGMSTAVAGAELRIIENNTNTEVLLQEVSPGQYESAADWHPTDGVGYRLEVKKSPYETAKARFVMPNPVEVTQGEMRSDRFSGENIKRFTFSLTDVAAEDNYYVVQCFMRREQGDRFNRNPLTVVPLDPLAENFEVDVDKDLPTGSMLLLDNRFNGETHSMDIGITDQQLDTGGFESDFQLEFWVSSVSKDLFEYIKTEELYRKLDQDNPFMQPVIVHSNIENGIGMLGCRWVKQFSVPLEDVIAL